MKIICSLAVVATLAVACKDSAKTAGETTLLKSDTTFVVQPELPANDSQSTAQEPPEPPTTKKSSATKSTAASRQSGSANTTDQDNAGTARSDNQASQPVAGTTAKKGWSKTAKGAVVGGVVGAGAGAVINKRNRVAGAVIGGILGAGAGAVVGNEMDKKDGRH